MPKKKSPINPRQLAISVEIIAQKIYRIREQKVMLDSDLAELYQVEPRALIQAVKRNIERFPEDFMFQLTAEEHQVLRSHFVILKPGRGKQRKYLPYVFTQEGVAMLSSVLRSPRAVQVNVAIMRAFVRLREIVMSDKELAQKLAYLEKKYDARFKVVFDMIRKLMQPSSKTQRRIGFTTDKKE
jgi:hypothetical protein